MSNNNVSDGPIPFFSSNDSNTNFLSGTNITDNSVPQTQSTQQAQPTQSTQQSKSQNASTAPKQSVQDVSSLFGNNKEDSFLSSINSQNSQNIQNNTSVPTSNLPNSNSLYYNQANNGSTTSLNQPYNNSYIPKSESNPQSITSSSSYTNLTAFNQVNNTTGNTSGYANMNTLNKSPYISSPEPNAATYNTSGTPAPSYAQGFYSNPATQGSQSNLSNYSKNYAATASNSSLNSFQSPQKTQSYPPPSYSNMYNQDQSKSATNNYSNYNQSYYSNTGSYLSPTSNNSNATPTTTQSSLYGTNTNTTVTSYSTASTTTTAAGYASTQTGTTSNVGTTAGYANTQTGTTSNTGTSATGYTNAQTGTTTNTGTSATGYTNTQTGYGTTQTSTSTGYTTASYTVAGQNTTNTYSTQNNSTTSGYSTPKPTGNTGYTTTNQSASTPYQTTGTSYQTTQTNTATNTGYAQTGTTNSKYSPYPQAATTNDNSLLNSSASYGSLTNLTTNNAALPPKDASSISNQTNGFTNYANNSSSQINYYSNTTTGLKNDTANPLAPSIRSNTPGASSINDLTADTSNAQTGMGLYSTASPNSGSFVNSSTSLNENVVETTTTNTTNPNFSSSYYQNKNSQGFYSNIATSNSSPCLNSMGTAYPASTTSSVRKNSYNDNTSGKHVKSNSVMSPGSTYQNSLYANNNGSVADNISFTGSVGSKNEPVASSLYYHDENNGKFRSPTAPPSSDNAAKLSPSSTNANLNRPPSVPPNYVSYNYGTSTTTTTTGNTATTSTWKPTATPNLTYSSYTAPTTSSYANTTTYPTSTTPNPYQPDTTAYSTSTTPNPYQADGTTYPTSTTPNPYQPDTTQYYGGTTDTTGGQNFYNFDNQSQGEIHSCDPIVMHQNLSPIVSFGFGGRLVVMFPKDLSGTSFSTNIVGPNTVHVKPISKFIYSNVIEDHKEQEGPILGQKKNKKQILEMLNKKINKVKSTETHYNSYSNLNASDSDEVLILKVIQLYIENDGVLYGQNSKPEAVQSLRNLLLSDTNPVNTTHTMINGPSVNSSEIENIKNCLLQGDRPGACKIAVNNKLWAHALIISSYINKETYKDVVNSFIKSELQGENESQKSSFQSIKVLYSLFAGMGKDAIIDSSSSMPLANSLATQPISSLMPTTTIAPPSTTTPTDVINKWKEILGMILSNRTPNDVSAIVSLGDTLLNSNKLYAAHLCYLFSPSSISGLSGKATKAVLLGIDHHKNRKFYKDLNAFQITEFLEYMYYMSNKNMSTMPHFQAYKLIYANWLADIGLVTKAFSYAQCIMQIMKSGTSTNNNGTTSSSVYYNQTLFENLKEFTSRCQGHFSGTKNAPKDGWFSKITKFDTFLEAFDHGLNKFIGTTEDGNNIPNLTNNSTPQPAPVAMMTPNTYNNTTTAANLGLKSSSSYQNINQSYYKNSYSTDNIHSAQGSRKNSFSKDNQKGVFSLIGNLFNKGSNAPTANNSSTNSLNNQDESNKNGYYDSITKQWVTTNTQSNDKFGNDIAVPPPAASDFYSQGYNTTGMNNTATSGTLSNGVIPQFGSVSTPTGMTNPRRNNRTKYNDPTLSMAYSNTTTNQVSQNSTGVQPSLYSSTTGTTLDNQNNSTYNGYNYYGN
ncbi:hypothetical protein PIROE2DRAFT_2978 [Piromyces sp. E2]|nr:hypothetical protein PIROE2DRAFT_2978 [Piromyces sp. E2]|eukprot:OUM69093.1 hypothetical protein PIROE2DRAFT_2978 [Piromyces sp. E2]